MKSILKFYCQNTTNFSHFCLLMHFVSAVINLFRKHRGLTKPNQMFNQNVSLSNWSFVCAYLNLWQILLWYFSSIVIVLTLSYCAHTRKGYYTIAHENDHFIKVTNTSWMGMETDFSWKIREKIIIKFLRG